MEKPDLYSLLKQFSLIGGMAQIGQPGFCLLMALWQKSNELNWAHQFTMTNAELLYKSGYNSEKAMIDKRNKLVQLGYFKYTPPKNRRVCGTYLMNFNLLNDYFLKHSSEHSNPNSISNSIPHSIPHSISDSIEVSSDVHSEVNIIKPNETKPNKGGKDISPPPPEEPKTIFLEFVMLTGKEHQKLTENMGEVLTAEYIERLNGYIGQIGEKQAAKKYTSHYHTIANWWRKDGKPQGKSPPENKPEPQSGLSYLRQKIDGG
jgi:hypothetical protein